MNTPNTEDQMNRKELIAEVLSTKVGTEAYVLSAHGKTFQGAWKEIVGLERNGSSNPTHSDARAMIAAVKKHRLDHLPRPSFPFETRPGRLPEDETNEKSWDRADNWCKVRKKLDGYGVQPCQDGIMSGLVEKGLIIGGKLNYNRVVKEAMKIRVNMDVSKAVKKYTEGKDNIVTVNQRTRHAWRKELLPTWNGIDEVTKEDLFIKYGSRQVAEDHADYCHKVPICQGARETTRNDVFLTSHHRTYDRIAKELDYPGHEAVVAALEDSLFGK